MEINYRRGEKEDSSRIAELINIASDGVVEFLFNGLVPGMSPVQVVAHHLENDSYPHTYKSVVVAEDHHSVVGMALSYPSAYHNITDEMRSFLPAERLAHLGAFYASRVENSWFLDALSVVESHRKRGIGTQLIALTKKRALENGFHSLSLVVFADNELALSLYRDAGFEIVQNVELRGNEYIKHEEGCFLIKCEITI